MTFLQEIERLYHQPKGYENQSYDKKRRAHHQN
jgi:hypothetical protein